MSSVMKERREQLGKDISEIANITRIKGSYLRAIEEEDYVKLPVEVYTRGYIKEYAEFLGIPADLALNPYEKYMESKGAPKGKEHSEKPKASSLSKENHDDLEIIKKIVLSESDEADASAGEEASKSSFLSGKMLWFFLLVIAAVGIYSLIPRQKEMTPAPPGQQQPAKAPEVGKTPVAPADDLNKPGEPSSAKGVPEAKVQPEAKKPGQAATKTPPETAMRPEGAAAKSAPAVTKEKPQPPEKAAAQKENTAAQKKRHSLDIAATGRTWIQVTIDGSEKRELMLNPGDKAHFGADKSLALKIGNGAGVALRYDGKEIKNLGGEGEVVNLNLPEVKPPRPAKGDSGNGAKAPSAPAEPKTSNP